MIKGFKTGKYYVYLGKHDMDGFRTMQVVLDRKPRKCVWVGGRMCASLEGVEPGEWYWYDLENWHEIDPNKPDWKLLVNGK